MLRGFSLLLSMVFFLLLQRLTFTHGENASRRARWSAVVLFLALGQRILWNATKQREKAEESEGRVTVGEKTSSKSRGLVIDTILPSYRVWLFVLGHMSLAVLKKVSRNCITVCYYALPSPFANPFGSFTILFQWYGAVLCHPVCLHSFLRNILFITRFHAEWVTKCAVLLLL